jgi:hypothetical protein
MDRSTWICILKIWFAWSMYGLSEGVVKGTPLSVVFGFCIYFTAPIKELIKSICGRTSFVTFRDLPVAPSVDDLNNPLDEEYM